MNRRTWTLIGLTVAVLGMGMYALGLAEGESSVRQVGQVMEAPEDYASGSWILVGVPQPETIPSQTPNGTVQIPNPEHRTWLPAGTALHEDGHSYTRFDVSAMSREGQTHWSLRMTNATFTFESPQHVSYHNWTTNHAMAFPIQGFAKDDVSEAWVWATYDGVLRDPLQPKPSQFEGRMSLLDVGIAGAKPWILDVETITIGCSSKFLPDDHEDGVPADAGQA